ncbi:hypothetical protein CgunFtcFv8_008257 [Champsocephalus gunnari]|uniref:Uncharacterized protein n=2 Tax=Champsocephalus gunnari TaxID=52237 RepID=A0AAN8D022_CHAGU|nr:hypothetical protein CgunFtcFv8_008257 [Champsocephalus gunnari]
MDTETDKSFLIATSCCVSCEAAAGILQVSLQLYFLYSVYIWLLMRVNHLYHEANDDIWQKANPAPLALYPPAPPPVLTTTAGSNQSVTSELCCNKSPPPLIFSFLVVFRSRLQQQKTTELQQASRLAPPPPCLRLGQGQKEPPFFSWQLPIYKPRYI